MARRIDSIEAFDELVQGRISFANYLDEAERGAIQIPTLDAFKEIHKAGIISGKDINDIHLRIGRSADRFTKDRLLDEGITKPKTVYYKDDKDEEISQPDSHLTDEQYGFIQQRQAIVEDLDGPTRAEINAVGGDAEEVREQQLFEALTEAGLNLPEENPAPTVTAGGEVPEGLTTPDAIQTDIQAQLADAQRVAGGEDFKPVIKIEPYTGPNGERWAKVSDPAFPNEPPVHVNLDAQDRAAAELERVVASDEADVVYRNRELKLREGQVLADTLFNERKLEELGADREQLERFREEDRALEQERINLAEQDLLRQQGAGAQALSQAITGGQSTLDTSGTINVGGEAVDFEITDKVLDFFGLDRDSPIALDTQKSSKQVDVDSGLGTRAATPLGELDEGLRNEVLGRPESAEGLFATLPTDSTKSLAANFSLFNEEEQNVVTGLANRLGLDLGEKLAASRNALPSGRGLFASFGRA